MTPAGRLRTIFQGWLVPAREKSGSVGRLIGEIMSSRYRLAYASYGIRMACGVATGVLVARFLTPAQRGELTVLAYYPTLMNSVFTIGTTYALTFVLASKREGTLNLVGAGIVVAYLLGLAATLIFAGLVHLILPERVADLTETIRAVCWFSPGIVIWPILQAILLGENRIAAATLIGTMPPVLYLTAVCVLIWMDALSPFRAEISALMAQAMAALVGTVTLILCARPKLQELYQNVKLITRQARRFSISHAAELLMNNIDLYLLTMAQSRYAIGLYSVAASFAAPLFLLAEPIAQLSFQEVSREGGQADKSRLAYRRSLGGAIAIAGGVGFILALGPFLLVQVYGSEYREASLLVLILAPAMGLKSLFKTMDVTARAKGQRNVGAKCTAIYAVVLTGAVLAAPADQSLWWFLTAQLVAAGLAAGALFQSSHRSWGKDAAGR